MIFRHNFYYLIYFIYIIILIATTLLTNLKLVSVILSTKLNTIWIVLPINLEKNVLNLINNIIFHFSTIDTFHALID
jgi:hypothetical protein